MNLLAAAVLMLPARASNPHEGRVRWLADLTHMGDDATPGVFPLQECESDCDSDWDCDWGLVCMFREGNENVPGCTGIAQPAYDYCVKRTSPTQLVLMGNNGAGSFPLQLCQVGLLASMRRKGLSLLLVFSN